MVVQNLELPLQTLIHCPCFFWLSLTGPVTPATSRVPFLTLHSSNVWGGVWIVHAFCCRGWLVVISELLLQLITGLLPLTVRSEIVTRGRDAVARW